jgi:hypothetical protein
MNNLSDNVSQEDRLADILAKNGEKNVRDNEDARYPELQAPDPSSGRFRLLSLAGFSFKHVNWIDVEGGNPSYSRFKGWSGVTESTKMHVGALIPKNMPDIVRTTGGMCCSPRVVEVFFRLDPDAFDVREIRIISDENSLGENYSLVGVKRALDIINWSQTNVKIAFSDILNKWMVSPGHRFGIRNDIDPSIHVTHSNGYFFSLEMIAEIKSAKSKGLEFINPANNETSDKF